MPVGWTHSLLQKFKQSSMMAVAALCWLQSRSSAVFDCTVSIGNPVRSGVELSSAVLSCAELYCGCQMAVVLEYMDGGTLADVLKKVCTQVSKCVVPALQHHVSSAVDI
jgi:hypothetical protein